MYHATKKTPIGRRPPGCSAAKRLLLAPVAVVLYAFIYVPFAWALLGQSFATRKPVRPEEVGSLQAKPPCCK